MTRAVTGETLTVDLGGTHMRCARVGPDGTITDREVRATPHDGTGTDALVELIRAVAASAPCEGAVIGVPGRVDYHSGRLEYAPNLPPGWIGGLTEAALGATVGLRVALANDADLAAVGEAYFGAGRDHADVAYVTLSTGGRARASRRAPRRHAGDARGPRVGLGPPPRGARGRSPTPRPGRPRRDRGR